MLLALRALPRALGSRFTPDRFDASSDPFVSLAWLDLLPFGKIKPDEDNDGPNVEAYPSGKREYAEYFRKSLSKTLVNTPDTRRMPRSNTFVLFPNFPCGTVAFVKSPST